MQTKSDEAMFDPICGKCVDSTASHSVEYKKRTYLFCSLSCKERFEHQAERLRMKDLAPGRVVREPQGPLGPGVASRDDIAESPRPFRVGPSCQCVRRVLAGDA